MQGTTGSDCYVYIYIKTVSGRMNSLRLLHRELGCPKQAEMMPGGMTARWSKRNLGDVVARLGCYQTSVMVSRHYQHREFVWLKSKSVSMTMS